MSSAWSAGDDTKPGAAEQYSDAIGRGQARDIVGAAGMAGRNERVGALLWRALHGGDRTVVVQLRTELFGMVMSHATRKHWPGGDRAKAKPLAAQVLGWYLNNACRECKGRRYRSVPGVDRVLSDAPCAACHGTGLIAIERIVPILQIGRAKEIAVLLDLAESRMAEKIDTTRRMYGRPPVDRAKVGEAAEALFKP